MNGYKQLDPTRGAAYIFDLILFDADLGLDVHKRVDVMRSFGNIEIVPMPYVTESDKIHLVIPFSAELSSNEVNAFFTAYERSILSRKDVAEKVQLIAVFFNSPSKTYR